MNVLNKTAFYCLRPWICPNTLWIHTLKALTPRSLAPYYALFTTEMALGYYTRSLTALF